MANEVAKRQTTGSEKFLNNIVTQFNAEAGSPVMMTDYQKSLGQHLFLKLDSVLKDLETKRLSKDKPYGSPFTWENVNMRKLALDSVHTVQLGLDALIPNHVHPIAYFNKKEKKYDIDLRPGYIGKAYYRTEAARVTPKDITYELVYSNDKFKAIKKSINNPQDSYEFEITNPFDRGEIIGGFGYISYESDKHDNVLVLVSKQQFDKSRNAAQSDVFWKNHYEEMCYKTLVHRTTEKLQIDPRKVNAAYLEMENKDDEDTPMKQVDPIHDVQEEIDHEANQTVVDFEQPKEEPKQKPRKSAEPVNDEPEQKQGTMFDNLNDVASDGPDF